MRHDQIDILINVKMTNMMIKIFSVFLLIFNIMLTSLHSLTNYTPYEITAFNMHERNFLYHLHVKNPKIIFMNGVTNEAAIPMDLVVRTDEALIFEEKLHSFDIQFIRVPQILK